MHASDALSLNWWQCHAWGTVQCRSALDIQAAWSCAEACELAHRWQSAIGILSELLGPGRVRDRFILLPVAMA